MNRICLACVLSCTCLLNVDLAYAQTTSSDDEVLIDNVQVDESADVEEESAEGESEAEDNDEDLSVGTVADEIPDIRTQETMSGKKLDDTKGLSLGRALEAFNGVRAIETGTVAKPMIHGFFGSRLLLLVDGIRHEAQSWGLDHAPEIDPNAAARLTVIKGAGGVRYGSNAIGGVVLIAPPRIPLEPGATGSLSLVGNSNDRSLAASADLQTRLFRIEPLGFRFQTSVKRAGSAQTPDYVLDNTGHEEYNVSGAVHWDKPDYKLQFGASRYRSVLGIFTGQVAENRHQFAELIASDTPLGADAYRFDYEIERPYQEVNHTLVYGRGSVDLTESIRTTVELSHQINERLEFDKVRRSVEGPQYEFDLRTTRAKLLAEFDALDFIFGGIGAQGGVQENVYQGIRLIPNYRTFSGGAFAWSQFVFEGWETELGARLDFQSVDSFQREPGGGVNSPINENEFTYVTPSFVAGVLWRPTKTFFSKLSFASASRTPTVNELFIDGVSQGLAGFEEGDQDLKTERAYSLNLDTSYTPAKWFSAHLTGYVKYINDYINLSPKLDSNGEPAITTTVNGGFPTFAWSQTDSLFYGADAEAKILPLNWLKFTSKVSVVFARDLSEDKYLTLIPAPFFEQELRATRRKKVGPFSASYLSAKSVLNLKQTRVEANADFVEPPDTSHLIHLGVGTQWKASSDTILNIDLDCRNVLNTKYRNYLSRLRYFADEPGRAIFLRMKLTL